jgi:DNA polymerase-1
MRKSVLKTYDEVKAWFDNNDLSEISLDFETTSTDYLDMDIYGFSICNGVSACYVDVADDGLDKSLPETSAGFYRNKAKIINQLKDLFKHKIKKWSAHNIPYELLVLHKLGIENPTEELLCTQTMYHLVNENDSKGLKYLARKYLGVPETEIKTWKEVINYGVHSKEFYEYGLQDAIWCWKLKEIFIPELKKQKLWDLWYNIERKFQWCLRDLAINGIKADKEKLLELQGQLKEEVEKLQLAMYDAGDIEYYFQESLFDGEREIVPSVNLNSPKQLSNFIRNELGIKLTEKTKPSKLHPTGQYSTKNVVLESIKHKHKFIELLLEYRLAFKLLNSFLIPLPNIIQDDGRIRVDFMNTVAVTGRLTCSRLHQLPKEQTGPVPVRECFVAPPGKVLLCADYAGQELRVLAHVSQDPTMIQAFENKIDVHLLIANIFFELGIPDEALVETHGDYKGYRKKFKSERDKIKSVNFGIAYGKTYIGFAKDWGVSEEEAKGFIDNYFKRFPLLKKTMNKCSRKTTQQKGIRNLTGRIRRFEWVDNRAKRQAFNFLIQGPSADMMKKAAADVRNIIFQHPEWDCILVLSVHDELIWELSEEYVEEAMPIIKKTMEDAIELCIPVVVDIGWAKNYQEAKP